MYSGVGWFVVIFCFVSFNLRATHGCAQGLLLARAQDSFRGGSGCEESNLGWPLASALPAVVSPQPPQIKQFLKERRKTMLSSAKFL